jgi:hypothetical protein
MNKFKYIEFNNWLGLYLYKLTYVIYIIECKVITNQRLQNHIKDYKTYDYKIQILLGSEWPFYY